jgi:hypothetical protein
MNKNGKAATLRRKQPCRKRSVCAWGHFLELLVGVVTLSVSVTTLPFGTRKGVIRVRALCLPFTTQEGIVPSG